MLAMTVRIWLLSSELLTVKGRQLTDLVKSLMLFLFLGWCLSGGRGEGTGWDGMVRLTELVCY